MDIQDPPLFGVYEPAVFGVQIGLNDHSAERWYATVLGFASLTGLIRWLTVPGQLGEC